MNFKEQLKQLIITVNTKIRHASDSMNQKIPTIVESINTIDETGNITELSSMITGNTWNMNGFQLRMNQLQENHKRMQKVYDDIESLEKQFQGLTTEITSMKMHLSDEMKKSDASMENVYKNLSEQNERKKQEELERLNRMIREIEIQYDGYRNRLDEMMCMQPRQMKCFDNREMISELCGLEVSSILFDSYNNHCGVDRDDFATILKGKSCVCILIEDTQGNIFGGFIGETIGIEKYHFDRNCYLFSIKRGNERPMKRYQIKDGSFDFIIHSDDGLFSFGEHESEDGFFTRDLHVCKRKSLLNTNQLVGSVFRNAFDYQGDQFALCDGNSFEAKRILVYQLRETRQMIIQREEYNQSVENERNERRMKERMLIENRIKIFENDDCEPKKIYDSATLPWKMNNSNKKFFGCIERKKNVCILMEDETNNIFGGFIPGPISTQFNNVHNNCLLFSLKKDGILFDQPDVSQPKQCRFGYALNENSKVISFAFESSPEVTYSYDNLYVNQIEYASGWSIAGLSCDEKRDYFLTGKPFFNVTRLFVYELAPTKTMKQKEMNYNNLNNSINAYQMNNVSKMNPTNPNVNNNMNSVVKISQLQQSQQTNQPTDIQSIIMTEEENSIVYKKDTRKKKENSKEIELESEKESDENSESDDNSQMKQKMNNIQSSQIRPGTIEKEKNKKSEILDDSENMEKNEKPIKTVKRKKKTTKKQSKKTIIKKLNDKKKRTKKSSKKKTIKSMEEEESENEEDDDNILNITINDDSNENENDDDNNSNDSDDSSDEKIHSRLRHKPPKRKMRTITGDEDIDDDDD